MSIALAACGHPHPATPQPPEPAKLKLAILPAESDAFPTVARATTDALVKAQLVGIETSQISKVSLEVVQLSIECVDATVACYQAVGHSLSANRILFAQIAGGPNHQVTVTITLFDVDTSAAKKAANKLFVGEDEASKGVAALVAEVTQ